MHRSSFTYTLTWLGELFSVGCFIWFRATSLNDVCFPNFTSTFKTELQCLMSSGAQKALWKNKQINKQKPNLFLKPNVCREQISTWAIQNPIWESGNTDTRAKSILTCLFMIIDFGTDAKPDNFLNRPSKDMQAFPLPLPPFIAKERVNTKCGFCVKCTLGLPTNSLGSQFQSIRTEANTRAGQEVKTVQG